MLVESLSKRRSQASYNSEDACLRLAATSLESGAGTVFPTHCPASAFEDGRPTDQRDGDTELQEKPKRSEIVKAQPHQHQVLTSLQAFIEIERERVLTDSECTGSLDDRNKAKANGDVLPRPPQPNAAPVT